MKKLLIALIIASLILISPVMAWGASVNVAAVDDYGSTYTDRVRSSAMGSVWYVDYPAQTFTTVEPVDVSAATLANYDTLFLFAINPDAFTAGQKTDIVNFVLGGGKLIIWDSEDPGTGNSWDYSWLPSPFTTAVPGAQGAQGILTILEENMLSSNDPVSPYYINAGYLGPSTDAVGDANVFTSYISSDWCIDMEAKNTLQITGPTHVYTKAAGAGIVIYCGLDWDYAGSGTGDYSTGATYLKKILRQEFNADYLPCSVQPTGNLDVTKTADKSQYNVGDIITFTVTVTNNDVVTVENIGLVDYPPAEISLLDPANYNLGTLAPGQSNSVTITAEAMANGCGIENSAVATGYYLGYPYFTGSDTVIFNIGSCIPAPEFPTLAVPLGMLIGILSVVVILRGRKE